MEKHTQVGRRYRLVDLLETFRKTLMDELDFQREAGKTQDFIEGVRAFLEKRKPTYAGR